jgi:hypothetical protein
MDMLANNFDTEDLIEWGFDNGELVGFETEDEPKEQDDLSDDLKDTFEVIIECGDEEFQEATYNKLIKDGFVCRVLTL